MAENRKSEVGTVVLAWLQDKALVKEGPFHSVYYVSFGNITFGFIWCCIAHRVEYSD